jgi:hypothetical protein
MTDSVPLSVNVTNANADGIELLMKREQITVTQAVHRILTYGLHIYEVMAIEGKEVYFEFGTSRERFRLLNIADDSDSDPVPESKV